MTNRIPENIGCHASVCAVVVTFHPDIGLLARIDHIGSQVHTVVVVDNASGASSAQLLQALSAVANVTIIRNAENLGIARALNQGVDQASAGQFVWALLLDQDTDVDPGMVTALLATAANYPQPAALAVVGSRFKDTAGRAHDTLPLESAGELWQSVESVITSGSLLSLAAYSTIGPFRDEFFIDHVDTEYCLRARAVGFGIIETRTPLMAHTVGSPSQHHLWGKTKWTTNHSPDRRYYVARNNTVMLREYGLPNGGSWRVKSVVRCIRLCKRIAFYEDHKAQKIFAVVQGWWDGMRGNMGSRHRRT